MGVKERIRWMRVLDDSFYDGTIMVRGHMQTGVWVTGRIGVLGTSTRYMDSGSMCFIGLGYTN